jgi:2-hydroxy-3-oxopropionate reductase
MQFRACPAKRLRPRRDGIDRALSLSLPNTATTQELFNAAALGGKGWDHSGLVRVLEHLAGHPVAK